MSSRICVKNLPKHVAEDRLKEFFSQKGEVTDAKLIRTKERKSRQFGFVGFRSEREAEEAIKFFNNSFMDTCRITCEIARRIGDPEIPRPWSRHSLKKQDKLTEEKQEVAGMKDSRHKAINAEKNDPPNDDPELQEFLQVMQPRAKSKLWANDILAAPLVEQNQKAKEKQIQVKEKGEGKKKSSSVVDEMNETNEAIDGKLGSQTVKEAHTMEHEEVVSDMEYFRSRVKKDWSDSEADDNEGVDDEEDVSDNDDKKSNDGLDVMNIDRNSKPDSLKNDIVEEVSEEDSAEKPDGMGVSGEQSTSLKDDEEVLESGRLFVRNLPYTATEDDLEEHFSKFGNVSQVHLVVDKDTKRSKGIAYVLYTLAESAARALEELDNSIFQGRLLHIMPAKRKDVPGKQEVNGLANHSKTFKQQREEEKKSSEASGNTSAWNSLFMRSDTVVENIARKFGVSKSELLDREAADIAVRIALGETQVIAETKKALANAGINVASLEKFATEKHESSKRSNHVILVKNLPYGSSESELASMFMKFGSLDKVIFPPTRTLCLVVFIEPSEARAAFRGLAYKRYKDTPVYLEWAPSDILTQNPVLVGDTNNSSVVGEHDAKRVLLEQQIEGISDADIDPERIETTPYMTLMLKKMERIWNVEMDFSRSLFVKNLNFKTSDEGLRKHFSEHMKEGKILSVRVKKHLKNGKNVSMGFGFIEFDSMDTATNICRDLQGTVLDGHALILQLCRAKKDERALKKVENDQSSMKLIVRNVAFEATAKELRQLFSPFGQVKSLRLPTRFGKHRGFAFVEFVTKQEAQNALQALSSTHLYGRHLVLERAKDGESLEELRARTATQFTDEQNGFQNPTKLSRKRKQLAALDEGSGKFERITD